MKSEKLKTISKLLTIININDARESTALDIIDTVVHKGGIREICGLSKCRLCGTNHTCQTQQSEGWNHTAFDVEFIQKNARLIVDMRNMIKDASNNVYSMQIGKREIRVSYFYSQQSKKLRCNRLLQCFFNEGVGKKNKHKNRLAIWFEYI